MANQPADELLKEKLASLKELAYGASHEINNPLANIAIRAQLLLAAEKDETRRKHLSTIYQQAMRAHEMIADMMLFAHPPQPALKELELGEFIQAAAVHLDPLVRQFGWTLRCIRGSDMWVQADSVQLMALLQAIVQNSLESRPNGEVVLSSEFAGEGWVKITVSDNGPGVSATAAEHMFDPFYSGREAGRGLGFGLSKAWTIAQLHGGNIRVQSTGPQGTTIAVSLPSAAPANDH